MGLAGDVTYRDRVLGCPRCSAELERSDTRDRWQCPQCRGDLFSVEETLKELHAIVPDLGRGQLVIEQRRTVAEPLRCPACGASMEPSQFGGVDIDRCEKDQLLWFDGGEHPLLLDHARDDDGARAKSWIVQSTDEP